VQVQPAEGSGHVRGNAAENRGAGTAAVQQIDRGDHTVTNEERWQIEGRTREALRQAKKNVASLKIEIEEYAEKLKEGAESLRHFVANPVGPGPTGMTSRQYTLHFFKTMIAAEIQQKLAEYEHESERVQDLEKKVGAFE